MSKKTEYEVITGCNIGCTDEKPEGTRYEAGDTIPAKSLKPEQVKALIELGCIEE
jgi:hypothetical protein